MFGEVYDADPVDMSRYTTEGGSAGHPGLRIPGAGQELRQRPAAPTCCATCSPATTTTPTRTPTSTRRRRSSATTTWGASATSSSRRGHRRQPRGRRRAARARRARPLADVPDPRPARRLLRRRAGLRRRRRRPGRPAGHVRQPGRHVQRRRPDRHRRDHRRRTTTAPATRCSSTSRRCRRCARPTPRWPTARRSTATPPRTPASTPSAASTPTDQIEYVVAANNSEAPATATFDTFTPDGTFGGLYPTGAAALTSDEEGRVTVTVPPLSVAVWKGAAPIPASAAAPAMTFRNAPGSTVGGRAEVGVAVPAGGFNQVSFAWRPAGSLAWTPLGTDDNAPYRVFHDVQELATGTVSSTARCSRTTPATSRSPATSAVVGDPARASGRSRAARRAGRPTRQRSRWPATSTPRWAAPPTGSRTARRRTDPPSGRRLVGDIHPPGRRLPVQGGHERRLGPRTTAPVALSTAATSRWW